MERIPTLLWLMLMFVSLSATTALGQTGDDDPDGSASLADRPEGERGRRFGRPELFRGEFRPPQLPLMTALDADRDGEISPSEIENAAAALKSLDANEDGRLTRDELRPQFAFRPPDGARDRDVPPPDARRVERPDRPGPPEGHRREAEDRGPRGDGPPRPEAGPRPGFGGPGRLIDHVMKLDADDDDQLTQEEVLKLFATADQDANGFLTRRELEGAVRDYFREQFAEHGPPPHRPPYDGGGPRRGRGPERDRPDRPERPE